MHVIPTRRSSAFQWRFPYGLICSQMPPSIAKLPVSPGELHAQHRCIRHCEMGIGNASQTGMLPRMGV